MMRRSPLKPSAAPMKRTAFARGERIEAREVTKVATKPAREKKHKCAERSCRTEFVRPASFVIWCSPECGAVLAMAKLDKQRQATAKAERKERKEKLAKFKRKSRATEEKPFVELRHAHLITKLEKHPGIDSTKFLGEYRDSTGRALKCYYLPKREACLMAMSYSYELQTKVWDRMAALEAELSRTRLSSHRDRLSRVKYADGTQHKLFESGSANLAQLLRIWTARVIEKGRERKWVREGSAWDAQAAQGLYRRVAERSLAHWLDGKCASCSGSGNTAERRICVPCKGTNKSDVGGQGFERERVLDMVSELEGLMQAHAQEQLHSCGRSQFPDFVSSTLHLSPPRQPVHQKYFRFWSCENRI